MSHPSSSSQPPRPGSLRAFAHFLAHTVPPSQRRTALVICLTMLPVALSYGALSAAAGLKLWQTAMLAATALGGSAELTFIAVIAGGGLPIFGVIGGWLVNTRNFAFGLNVGQYTPNGWRSFAAAHFVNDESTAFARMVRGDRARWGNFIVMAAGVFITWVGGAVIGQLIGSVIDAEVFGLDAAFPVLLVAMVAADLRRPFMGATAAGGVLIAVVMTPLLPLGLGAVSSLIILIPAALALALIGRRGGGRP